MKRLLQRVVGSRALAFVVAMIVRGYTRTFHVETLNEAEWKEHHAAGGRVLMCMWHQHFFTAIRDFPAMRSYGPAVMISQSRDGDIVANVAEQVGWKAIRGSSSRGGAAALLGMVAHLKQHGLAANLVDGPRGPAGRVKPGLIRIAHAADAVIVPVYVTVDRAWHFNSWDRFFIPKPFSRAVLRFGEKIALEPTDDRESFEAQRLRVEKIMRVETGLDPATPG